MFVKCETYKNKIYSTYVDDNNEIQYDIVSDFKPEIFKYHELGKFKSLIENIPLKKIECDNINSYNNFLYKNKEGDTPETLLYNKINPEYQYMRYKFKDRSLKPVRTWLFDIETDVMPNGDFPNPFKYDELPPITLLQVHELDTDITILWGWKNKTDIDKKYEKCKYIKFDTEKEMLEHFISFYRKRKVSILTAWHGDNFDFPYIYKRCKNLDINIEKMSNFDKFKKESHKLLNENDKVDLYKPYGSYWIDYVNIYKNIQAGGRESWSLEYIANYHNVEAKLDFKSEGFKNIKDFMNGKFTEDYCEDKENSKLYKAYKEKDDILLKQLSYSMFCEYGRKDVIVMRDLEKKLNMINITIKYAQEMSCNFDDTLTTVTPWTNCIYNDLYDKNIAIPSKTLQEKGSYAGGYVYANIGIHKYDVSSDVNSMYPNITIMINASPETFVNFEDIPKDLYEEIKILHNKLSLDDAPEDIYRDFTKEKKERITKLLEKYNFSMAPNGVCFRKDFQGVVPRLTEMYYNNRVEVKKDMKKVESEIRNIKDELGKRGLLDT